MERFTLFYALAELAKNKKNRHEFKEICLMYAVGLIIVVLSYPLIRHLA